MDTRTICNIIVYAHRKWIRLLEYHAYFFPEQGCINLLAVNIFSVNCYRSINLYTVYQIIHTI